jgi:hypothetical protein
MLLQILVVVNNYLEQSHVCWQLAIVCFFPVLCNFDQEYCKWNVFVYIIVWSINVKLVNIAAQDKVTRCKTSRYFKLGHN